MEILPIAGTDLVPSASALAPLPLQALSGRHRRSAIDTTIRRGPRDMLRSRAEEIAGKALAEGGWRARAVLATFNGPRIASRWCRASARSATADTIVRAAAALSVRSRARRFQRAGSAKGGPTSSSRRPINQNGRSPDRHNRSKSANGGNASRPAVIACSDRPSPGRARTDVGRGDRPRRSAATYCAWALAICLAAS